MELELAKGMRDFPPEEQILRDEVISKIKTIFERYGFSPLGCPIVERLDLMTAKFGAGETSDAMKEVFKLKDQGNRDLGLRFELTFQLARFVAMNQLKMPFKRYQIGPVYRDGPIKAGRYREFLQCDIDTVGSEEPIADAEIIIALTNVYKELGVEAIPEINNRKLLFEMMNYTSVPKELQDKTIIIIDKLKKYGAEQVKKELTELGLNEEVTKKVIEIISINGDNKKKLSMLKKILGKTAGITELENLFDVLKEYKTEYTFLPSLARGLGYYTGTIFEFYTKDTSLMSSSIGAGGRWDNMIGSYVGNTEMKNPAVGGSVGLEPTIEVIKKLKGMGKFTPTELLVIPIGQQKEAIKTAQKAREKGINTSIELIKRGVGKSIEYADKLKIPFVAFIGEEEVKAKKIKIKNMNNGEEKLVSVQEAMKIIKKELANLKKETVVKEVNKETTTEEKK